MRRSLVLNTMLRLLLVGTLVSLGGRDLFACSGPGAAQTIRQSELIGWSFAGLSITIVAVGFGILHRRSLGRRIAWIVPLLALHPRLWMDAVHGDCGSGLRWWSFVATLWLGGIVALAISWPHPARGGPKSRRVRHADHR